VAVCFGWRDGDAHDVENVDCHQVVAKRRDDMADFPPTRPGELLREDFLRPLGMSQYALAKALGVPEIRISEIVRGKRAVTADTALRLARYFGTTAEFWLGMQASYDLEVARARVGATIDAAVRPRAA
jgi:antitoxin HigA-1